MCVIPFSFWWLLSLRDGEIVQMADWLPLSARKWHARTQSRLPLTESPPRCITSCTQYASNVMLLSCIVPACWRVHLFQWWGPQRWLLVVIRGFFHGRSFSVILLSSCSDRIVPTLLGHSLMLLIHQLKWRCHVDLLELDDDGEILEMAGMVTQFRFYPSSFRSSL